MDEKNYTGTIPENRDGVVIDSESIQNLPDERSARMLYETAQRRLLDVNDWNGIATKLLSKFQLTDKNGAYLGAPAEEGNYIKINIIGPGTATGDGYDWVRVESIEKYASDNVESIGMRVRPAANPTESASDIAHFYTDDSTSTFTITREGTKVTAAVYDRNIKVNSSSESLLDQARNSLIGLVGKTFFSKIQWQYLATAWVEL
ncbi:hypothetical protein [Dyadobacter arcticus]|uniref:Uncharacterized protein n=1 Tax=Dyadobacter arcticus TaxID=1078754 RepID=A0ABX0UN45_9BACT|nr:hypothetical protein [Dyadobacter arcticus]NIJ54371.1 hypothetical protein [Dyadobacter arcticus]